MYGPYWRWQSTTQTLEIAARQVISSEMWGRVPRGGYLAVPTVQAYDGPLPPGRNGIEFYTPVRPDQVHPICRWFESNSGTSAVVGQYDTILIPVTVIKVVQDVPTLGQSRLALVR
jgi:hypothetical protein